MCVPRPRRGSHPDFPLGAHVGANALGLFDPHADRRIPLPTYLAMEPAAKWPAGSLLTYSLGPGPKAMQDEFRAAVATVAALGINLSFNEVPAAGAAPADCRVELADDGMSWSDVGQDCRLVPLNEPTTHIGWPDDLARSIHEFMHFLGWMHNQAIPNPYLHLDKQKCYAYFGGAPNYWSRAMVDSQVLYQFTGEYLGSGFDPASIMQYAVDPALTTDGKGIPWNQTLSVGDVHDLRSVYAVAAPPKPPVVPPTPPSTPLTPTSLTLSVAPPAPAFGQPVRVSAVVDPASGTGIPAGDVVFDVDGAAATRTVPAEPLNGLAVADLAVSAGSLAVGTHRVVAAFKGGPGYAPSAEAALTFTVGAPVPPPTPTPVPVPGLTLAQCVAALQAARPYPIANAADHAAQALTRAWPKGAP